MKRSLCVGVVLIVTTSLARWADAGVVINANFVTSAPSQDGSVDPSQYGGGPAFSADFSNLNAGNPSRLSAFVSPNSFITVPNSTYSYDMYAAYTSTTLYLGFVVKDNVVSLASKDPIFNSDIELYIGGNPNGNNFRNYGAVASKQAFQLASDAAGDQYTNAGGTFSNANWSVAHSAVSSQNYTLQFAIPLELIDTEANGGFTPPHAGSDLHFNVAGVKNDEVIAAQQNYSVLDDVFPYGQNYPASNEYAANGTLIWAADLHLSSVPEPVSLVLLGVSVPFLLAVARARRRPGGPPPGGTA